MTTIMPHTTQTPPARTLDQCIQDLPPELNIMIFEAVLQHDQIVHINSKFQTPCALRLCQRTRRENAPAYFANTKFVVHRDDTSWVWFRKVYALMMSTDWDYGSHLEISTTHSYLGFDVWEFKKRDGEVSGARLTMPRDKDICVKKAIEDLITNYQRNNRLHLRIDGFLDDKDSFTELTYRSGKLALAKRIVEYLGLQEGMPGNIGHWKPSPDARVQEVMTDIYFDTLEWAGAGRSPHGYDKHLRYVAHAMVLHGKTNEEIWELCERVGGWLFQEVEGLQEMG